MLVLILYFIQLSVKLDKSLSGSCRVVAAILEHLGHSNFLLCQNIAWQHSQIQVGPVGQSLTQLGMIIHPGQSHVTYTP